MNIMVSMEHSVRSDNKLEITGYILNIGDIHKISIKRGGGYINEEDFLKLMLYIWPKPSIIIKNNYIVIPSSEMVRNTKYGRYSLDNIGISDLYTEITSRTLLYLL